MTQLSDKNLIDTQILDLMRKQKHQGFELLFHTYYSQVCQHIYRIHPRLSVVEDIAQDIFLELWRKRGELQIETSPGAYLRRMAVTRTLNYLRDNKQKRFETDEELQTETSPDVSPSDLLVQQELSDWVTKSIDELPERCRQVFMLSRFEGFTNQEIATAMEISHKTVENQMTKALKHLREAYARFRAEGIGDGEV